MDFKLGYLRTLDFERSGHWLGKSVNVTGLSMMGPAILAMATAVTGDGDFQ